MILASLNDILKKEYGPRTTLLYGVTTDLFGMLYTSSPFLSLVSGEAFVPPVLPPPEDRPGVLSDPVHDFDCLFVQEGGDDYEDYETSSDTCTCDLHERTSWRGFFRALDLVIDPDTNAWRGLFKRIDWYGI